MTNQQAINILLSLPLQAPSDGELVEIQTAVNMAIKALEEKPHGKWISAEDAVFVKKCSICNEDAEWLEGGSQFLSKYCPNCGAKMDGGEEE